MLLPVAIVALLSLAQSAPAPLPFYTRSLVHTPTSRVEQYVIMPDKSKPFRVPVSQVHHYSDFQFPRQQLVYYHPDGHNQYSLHEMRRDHPIMQQMVKDLKASDNGGGGGMEEAMMIDEMMKTSTDSNMMEKLKRDDGIMTEMINAIKETTESTTTDAPKVFSDAIVVVGEENAVPLEADEKNEIPQMNVEMVKMMLKKLENSEEILKNPEVIEMMRKILEESEKVEETSTTEHPLMTQVILASTEPAEELMEMLKNNQISEEKMMRIADLLTNVDRVTQESEESTTTVRTAKTLNLEIVEETKTEPEIQLRLVEEIPETFTSTESPILSTSTEAEAPQSEVISTTEAKTETDSSTESNEISRMEIIKSMLGVLEQNLSLMQKINSEMSAETSEATTEEAPRIESTTPEPITAEIESTRVTENELRTEEVRMESSTAIENESTTKETRLESTTAAPTTAAEVQSTRATESESTTEEVREESTTASAILLEATTEAEESTSASPAEESSTIFEILQRSAESSTPETPPSSSEEEENSSENSAEASGESENSSEETSAAPQRENTRQGRVNNAPTIFLHNNRFYVVSGAPEFYANFDAYESPSRTPIFSLQELQPIRPIDKDTPVQRIEPFRITAEDAKTTTAQSTQNDNERENEPLKLRSGQDNDGVEGERSGIMRNVEQQREVKKQDRQSAAGEDVNRDLSEDSSLAQANPSGIAIAGRGGVALSRPSGTALTGDRGLSVASPQATAVAGVYNLNGDDDDDRKRQQLRRMRRVRKQ